jgi:hypothetical protein
MGTHCFIGLEDKKDSTVRYIYIHYDGYFSHIANILRKHYTKRENVELLISVGDQTSLAEPSKLMNNTEEENKAKLSSNRFDFVRDMGMYIPFCYLFSKDRWEWRISVLWNEDRGRSLDFFDLDELA